MTIDVSKWQGSIDWAKVKASGVDGVFIKATEGVGYTDPFAREHSHGASANNIKIGYYHFCSLNNKDVASDASSEANYFLKTIKTLPAASLPLVLDIESNKSGIDKKSILTWIKTFFSELEKQGFHDYVLYSYASFLDSNLPLDHNLGNIRLWLAAYVNTPKLPKGWSSYWLWQYTQKGKINGIKTNVDLNKYA